MIWQSKSPLLRGIFRDIDAYSATLTVCKNGGEGRPPHLFLKTKKSVLILKERLWLFLRVSKRKKTKMFRCVASFSHVIDEMFISFCTPPCSQIFLVAHLYSAIILSAKRSILTVWQCCRYFCLGNRSVICTLTSCYVLHQTYSEFWHIQHCFSGIYWHIQLYSTHIHTHWDII